MRFLFLGATMTLTALSANAQSRNEDDVATLYRSSVFEEIPRIHIATFDTEDGFAYNWENCQIAAWLFAEQPGVSVRYWCEKGFYRK
ncbi:MAG: hypothetical protein P1U53_01170 [Sulfitobacter sp.]|nr:hypothetical protein [Sulfitobacter sp.]